MEFNNELYEIILDNLNDGVYFVDRDKKILYWNKGAENITGFFAEEVIGNLCWNNVLRYVDAQGKTLCEGECPILKTIVHGKVWEAEVYLHHKDGHRVPVVTRAIPIKNTAGEITGAVEIFSDNSSTTALSQRVKELQEIAFLDSLTHLANRRYIELNIQDRFSELNRYGWPFGIILADVDRFKSINDTYGHDLGDQVLKMVAKTLPACLRLFDIVGRWGGDEFVAIVINVRKKHLSDVAQRFLSLVRSSGIPVEREFLRVSVSIGATRARPDDTVTSVLKRADNLMYKSKALGGNCISVDR
jgi:diguanylate cyclase (GGDEF)-like protein/PAS domain S-box-containing protein